MLPMRMGAASCGARQCRGIDVRRRGRDSPQQSSHAYNMRPETQKEKLILFMVRRNKNNALERVSEELEGRATVTKPTGYCQARQPHGHPFQGIIYISANHEKN